MNIKEFMHNNKLLVILTIIFLLISLGFLCICYTFGVDTEYSIFIESSPTYRWIAQGRFGIGFIKKIFATNDIKPFRNTFLSLICIFLNSIFICKLLSRINTKTSKMASIIHSLIYVTFPIVVHYMYFTTYNFEISLGMLITTISVYYLNEYFLFKKKQDNLLIGAILLTMSVSFYQSLVPVFVAMVIESVILYLLENSKEDEINKLSKVIILLLKYAAIFVVSMACYFILNKILLKFVPNEAYTSNFFAWKSQNVSYILKSLKEYFIKIYFKGEIYGSFMLIPTYIFMLLIVCKIVTSNSIKKINKLVIPLLLIILFLLPMAIPFVLGTVMPYRTQQVFLVIVPFIWYLAYYLILNKYLKVGVMLITLYIVFKNTMYTNKMLYSNYLRFNEDVNTSRQIVDRIYDMDIKDVENYPVVYLGKKETSEIPNHIKQELIGYSIYEWDNGNYVRIQALVTMVQERFNLVYYLQKDEETLSKARELSQDMPIWPAKGSVDLRGGFIIVKLSEQ